MSRVPIGCDAAGCISLIDPDGPTAQEKAIAIRKQGWSATYAGAGQGWVHYCRKHADRAPLSRDN